VALRKSAAGADCSNAGAVYGKGRPQYVSANIMGGGDEVAAMDALPWTSLRSRKRSR
jgi:hypothetical protein